MGPPPGPAYGPPPGAPGGKPKRGKTIAIVAGSVVGVLAVGGGAWAGVSFLSTGSQPAEALPASTVAYASVDLDPNGKQKIEALKLMKKFPALGDELDLDNDDDVRGWIFDQMMEGSSCELDFGDDIEPWLGNRFAVAGVDLGEEEPALAVVMQTDDEDAADAALSECSEDEDTGWAFHDGWVVVSEDGDQAEAVVSATADGTLASDTDFQHWTGEAGDPGIASMYVSPDAGKYLSEMTDGLGMGPSLPELAETPAYEPMAAPTAPESDELEQFAEDFQGFAGTLRLEDGGAEFEVASGMAGAAEESLANGSAGEVVSTLPESTAVAFGFGLEEGWGDEVVTSLAETLGLSSDEILAEAEAQTGLTLPEDAETLLGDSAALSVDSGIDVEELETTGDPSSLPVGLKVHGDGDEIESVLDKIRPQLGPAETVVGSSKDGDLITVSPDPDYRETLLDDGGLGSSDTFQNVLPEADDAAGLLYVDFDAGDDWLTGALESAGAPEDVLGNVEPLDALGVSSWIDGDVTHAKVRVTTD